jgi:acetolactate synthase-1/2/3 large subunit
MAIGAAIATGRKAIVIDGDGSFQMTMNELGTIAQYGLQDQIEIHIIDNGSGGIVSQFARLNGWNPIETSWATGNPRFETIASAYGLHVNVHHVKEEGVWPILEAGHAMNDMTFKDEGGGMRDE